ncbi:MAG TPA: methionine--tRNA ligase [Methylomirabilota bacterium]|nr:methionine--tRNA ligase [Methylomirabilota bacterium]
MSDTFYITTPIYYVNDMPHIGHIYTTVMADAIARYQRLRGRRVYFLTGTDEHGQKIEKAARSQGIEPIQLADRVVARYHDLWRTLGISHDDFIRTTQPRHQRAVAEIIARITAAGDISKGSYEGWYDARDEAFVPDSQVRDGVDTESGHPVERLAEPSYFFRLSAFADRLLDWYRTNPDCIRPRSRYNEVVRFVEGGLKDLSISRTSLTWGVPYPGDPDHVVYVWLDALTNYISALGFGADDDARYRDFWPASLHLVGKDILRFHCVYWPAFLMSAGLPLPRQVFGHGWWLQNDAKMSKSVGNVVRPDHLIHRFGADALRYFVAREMSFGQDANFSDEAFLERYNADLANALGNTASRTTAMTNRYLAGVVPAPSAEGPVPEAAAAAVAGYLEHMDALEPHRALEAAWQLLATLNGFLQERQPWNLAKDGDARRAELEAVLYSSLEGLRIASILIEPFMPTIAAELRTQLGASEAPVNLGEATRWGGLPTGTRLSDSRPLFPRVDITAYLEEATVETRPEAAAASPAEELVSIDQFARVKLKVGLVTEAERVPKSKKLVRLKVDLGEAEPRQLVAGIAERYEPEALVGRRIVVVANLQPAKLMGVESRGMLLAASVDGDPFLLSVDGDVPPGTGVR